MGTAPHPGPSPAPHILTIRTGHAEHSYALFNPQLYQLTLIQGEQEHRIDLGYSGSRLLERLLLVPGAVVSREELLSYAWSDRVVGSGSLNQQVYSLRQALGDDKNREIIQTLPRRGYQINPGYLPNPDTPSSAPGPRAALHSHEPASTPTAGRIAKPLLLLLAGFAALNVLGYTGVSQLSSASAFTSQQRLSNIELQLIEQSTKRLEQLREAAQPLSLRLNQLSAQGTHLTLSQSHGFYQLICQRKDRSARTFMFHDSQLPQLKDEQLLRCVS